MGHFNLGEETEQREFKKSTAELKEGVVSIVSILNKHGSGELYFGVKNNGDVLGQEISDKTTREISQAVANHIKPTVYRNPGEKTLASTSDGMNRPKPCSKVKTCN